MFTITIPLSDEKNLKKDRYIQVLEIKSDQGMIVSKDDYKTGFLVENIIRYSCVPIIIGISIWLVIYLWKIKDDEFKKRGG